MSRIIINKLVMNDSYFAKISYNQLVNLFEKHKKITVYVDHKNRIDLTYVPGEHYGIKFANVISLNHIERFPAHYIDDPDDERFKTITNKVLSPLNLSQVVRKFQTYYKKLKEGKIMKIKDLTDEEKEEIIRRMDKSMKKCNK